MYSGTNIGTQIISTYHTEPYSQRRTNKNWQIILQKRTPISGNHSHRSINVCVHWLHYHHNSRWQTLDRTRKNSSLLIIHTLFQPLHPSELFKQGDSISLRKLVGEVKLDEKTCLVLGIHTHSLIVFLPKEKQTAWATNIKEALDSKKLKQIHWNHLL